MSTEPTTGHNDQGQPHEVSPVANETATGTDMAAATAAAASTPSNETHLHRHVITLAIIFVRGGN